MRPVVSPPWAAVSARMPIDAVGPIRAGRALGVRFAAENHAVYARPEVERRVTPRSPGGPPMPAPRVAATPGELLALPVRHRPCRRRRASSSTTRPRFRAPGIHDVVWTATFSDGRGRRSRPRAGSSGRPPSSSAAPSASIHDLYMARGRGEVGGFTVPAINLRTQVFDMVARPSTRAAAELDCGHRHLRAGAQRAGVHVPAPRRVHHERPRRRHRGRLAGPGLRPGRPLPVQRREVRGRPRRRHGRRCARPPSTR